MVVKKIYALAFLEPDPPIDTVTVPSESVSVSVLDLMFSVLKSELLALQSTMVPLEGLQALVTYLESIWMTNRYEWNLYDCDDHRLSNDLEMWHVNMIQTINRKDNLWKFIKTLALEQTVKENEVTRILSGQDVPPQRRYQKQKEEVLAAAKAEYTSRRISAVEYINRLSYRMGH